MMKTGKFNRRQNQSTQWLSGRFVAGFTMVEQLTALVVMSIGLLAVANLQVNASQADRTAIYHTRALTMAQTIAENIRGNREGASNGNYVVDELGAGVNHICGDSGGVLQCDEIQMAEQDIFLWKQQLVDLETGLPGGEGSIAWGASGTTEYVVNIAWLDGGDSASLDYTVAL
ncbi:MAG: type IV pilus modification protein PilV [Gammaproteobacteria bacterium]|nr:type IV pilus modification protein PilV [Gammaproteobacteria bacterium]